MFAILALGDENNGAARGAMNPLLIGILIAVIGGSLGPLTGFAMNLLVTLDQSCSLTSLVGITL